MRHNKKQPKFSRASDHRRSLFRNLMSSLLLHGSLITTDAKARELKRRADILIGMARKGTLHLRRLCAGEVFGAEALQALFDRWGKAYPNRISGFTRMVKIGQRHGDAAPMTMIELIQEKTETPKASKEKVETA